MSDIITETVMLVNLIAASRVVVAREAAAATLGRRFPEVKVEDHPGKLDMADVLKEGTFTAPSIHIAVARLKNDERTSGDQDVILHFRAYVVAENRMIGGKMFKGDEVGYAMALGVLDALELSDVARWGLENIGMPEGAEGEPLFTLKTFDKGAVYYVVTWRQTLYREGRMLPNLGGYQITPGPFEHMAPLPLGGRR